MDNTDYPGAVRPVHEVASPVAALVLGIIGLMLALLAFLPCLGWVAIVPGLLCAILAVVLGVVAVKRSDNRTYSAAKGALTCGCISLVVIIGAIIYQGMILAPVMKQAEVRTEEFKRTAIRTVDDAKREMCSRGRMGAPFAAFVRICGDERFFCPALVPGRMHVFFIKEALLSSWLFCAE